MYDPFVEKIASTRTSKGKKVSGRMVETRSQKSSEGQKATIEVDVHPDPALDDNRAGRETEGIENRKLASESTPVEQGQDFATSTGILDQEEMSELSDVSTENLATTSSTTDNTILHGVTEKPAESSSFSERVKKTLENFFPFTIGKNIGTLLLTAMKQKPMKKMRTMTNKMTWDLK